MKTQAHIAYRTAQIITIACKYGALAAKHDSDYWCHRGALYELVSLALAADDQTMVSRLYRVTEAMSNARFYFQELRLNELRAAA